VHQSSTDAASSVLVAALNEGKDVILDGTLSWEPFVEQTIEMARNVHKYKYRMGVGYKVNEDGTVNENYWEKVNDVEENSVGEENTRKPYKLELVGVVCDGYLAVIRGIRYISLWTQNYTVVFLSLLNNRCIWPILYIDQIHELFNKFKKWVISYFVSYCKGRPI
jgi:hypothetical protein